MMRSPHFQTWKVRVMFSLMFCACALCSRLFSSKPEYFPVYVCVCERGARLCVFSVINTYTYHSYVNVKMWRQPCSGPPSIYWLNMPHSEGEKTGDVREVTSPDTTHHSRTQTRGTWPDGVQFKGNCSPPENTYFLINFK